MSPCHSLRWHRPKVLRLPWRLQQQQFKAEELEALVAPIALYPDTLLALVLMASTYPLEVVQADRWVKDNSKLKGDALKAPWTSKSGMTA